MNIQSRCPLAQLYGIIRIALRSCYFLFYLLDSPDIGYIQYRHKLQYRQTRKSEGKKRALKKKERESGRDTATAHSQLLRAL
jgi:hypothetical protein